MSHPALQPTVTVRELAGIANEWDRRQAHAPDDLADVWAFCLADIENAMKQARERAARLRVEAPRRSVRHRAVARQLDAIRQQFKDVADNMADLAEGLRDEGQHVQAVRTEEDAARAANTVAKLTYALDTCLTAWEMSYEDAELER